MNKGAPEALARAIADLTSLAGAPDIVTIAQAAGRPIETVAGVHFGVDDLLGTGALSQAAADMPLADAYDRLARDRASATVGAAHRGITAKLVGGLGDGETAAEALAAFGGQANVARARESLRALAGSALSIAKLTVAAGLLDDLAR